MPHSIADFETDRMRVARWDDLIVHGRTRANFATCLADMLTPPVLAHLPPSLHMRDPHSEISGWVDALAAQSAVYTVHVKETTTLVGLLIIAAPTPQDQTLHLGYLLAESAWGRGYATELLRGLVLVNDAGPRCQLRAGVARSNATSAQVLRKAGFVSTPDASGDVETFIHDPVSA